MSNHSRSADSSEIGVIKVGPGQNRNAVASGRCCVTRRYRVTVLTRPKSMMMRIIQFLTLCLLLTVGAQADGKQQVVEVPFDFYRNEIIIKVKVNGKGSFNMMLDTGTDPSAIDIATARELGLKLDPVGGKATGGGSGVNLAYGTKLPLVEFG